MSLRRSPPTDALLYVASAAFAGGVALWADIPQFREWGRLAAIPYAAGGVAALVVVWRGRGIKARWMVAAFVFLSASILPLSVEVAWRAHTEPGLHAQSEVIVTEEAARALARGHDPYVQTYLHGPLEARPTATKTHFPYLPGMLAFGLPRAVSDQGPWTDARVWFALAVLAIAAAVIGRRRATAEGSLLIVQVLVVLPTGAMLMATGGDDLPVLALMLLALVLLPDRPGWSGVTAGAAMALKQTAWILAPFLLVASANRRRTVVGLAAVVLPLLVPFVLWGPSAFVEDAIRFPLGLGSGASAAGTVTLGSILADVLPGGAATASVVLAVATLAAGLLLLRRQPWAGPAGAARSAAIVWALLVVLAPVARLGYVVYPINLWTWSVALRGWETSGVGRAGVDVRASVVS